ncbi:MAG: hypothetical protein PHH61_05770 [Candidatus Nanoarchaeia archaeon]|nr:hypothetical protein [Candidatus Nanoarchaeia archaeon]
MGEKENIIKRHLDAARENNIDFIVNQDGDDFLTTCETINAVYYQAKCLRFKKAIRTEGLPFGMNVIAYPRENLENADFSGDTGWGVHVTKDAYVLKFNYERPYRLSCDYPEDMEVMKDVYLNCKRNEFVGGIVKYLDKHPETANLNLGREEEYWEKIKEAQK